MMASGQVTEKFKLTQKEKIKELQGQKIELEKEINKLQKYFESREAIEEDTNVLVDKAIIFQNENKKLENINSQIEKLKEESSFDFNGFGSEYQSSNDYGWQDMTNEQIKELYGIKPDMFNDFAGQFILYEAGLVDEAPNTIFTIEKDVDNVVDLLRVDRSTRDSVVKEVLSGETYDLIDAGYYYENAGYYVDELKGFGYDSVIDKIVEITGYDKEEVKENGAEYYLNGEDENFDSDSFDDIKIAIGNALAVATEDNYARYIRKQIESALEELGTIEKLDDTGIVLNIDLSKLMSIGEISSYMKEENINDLEDVFYQVVELPRLDIDDRYEPYRDDWQEYFDINSYENGGVIYQDLSKIKPMVVNDKTVLTEFELKKSKSDIEIETQIRSSDDVVNILRQLWEKDTINAYEQAYVLFLNTNNKVIGYYHHSSGGISGTIMEVQMISGMAVKSLAKGVIIAHNHPSGNRKPSDADEKITKQLSEALKLFNIKLLDSIILTERSYLSLADEGILK
jgi:DNA repair protein RadC